MTTHSTQAKTQFGLLAPTEHFIFTIVVEHPTIQTMRFVVDTQDLQTSDGVYSACSADIKLPSNREGESPTVSISVGNANWLSDVIESTYGLRGATLDLQQRFRPRPDVIESSVLLDIKQVSMNNKAVSIQLGFASILDLPAIAHSYRRITTKGLY